MTESALSAIHVIQRIFIDRLQQRTNAALHLVTKQLDHASPRKRRAIAILLSVTLHLGLLLFLLPSAKGLSTSMGAVTGLGDVNGLGTAVTLVDVSELVPPKAAQSQSQSVTSEQTPETPETPASSEPLDDTIKPAEEKTAPTTAQSAKPAPATPSNSDNPSNTTTEATAGAFGQNGQANLDLWNAIAPCWNRIADSSTLPATLKITFDAAGGLAIPPEIERDPKVPITDQSLKAEAKALQALSECGAYPMAQGQQNVEVKFPARGLQSIKPAGT